jgi:hypothetical protein
VDTISYVKGKLTEMYSSLFEERNLKELPGLVSKSLSFVREAHRSGKLVELTSFLVWEIFHRFGLFSKQDYLDFAEGEALRLEDAGPDELDTSDDVARFFENRAQRIVRSEHDWKLLFIKDDKVLGCLYTEDKKLYGSSDSGSTIAVLQEFPESIFAIFVSNRNVVFVSTRGAIYRSTDGGNSFRKSIDLSSPESYFRLNYGMTETPSGMLVIGEYGNVPKGFGWQSLAYLYVSSDDGKTWDRSDFLREQGANKHVHLVRYCALLNKLVVADGDNKKRLWVSDILTSTDQAVPALKPVNRFHIQKGGHTSVTESDGRILFGTDYMGGTNFLLTTSDCRSFVQKVIPDPYRRSPIMHLIGRRSKSGNEIWALLPYSTSSSRCLLMFSRDHGESWNKVFEYNGNTHGIQLIGATTDLSDVLYLSVRYLDHRVVYKICDTQ